MTWIDNLKENVNARLQKLVGNSTATNVKIDEIEEGIIKRKHELLKKRRSELVKAMASGQIIGQKKVDNTLIIDYIVHNQLLVKQQNDNFYMEENLEPRRAVIHKNIIIKDSISESENTDRYLQPTFKLEDIEETRRGVRQGYRYERRAAVQYAEKWWNSYNPKYKKFEVDCTNYVSQCLHEGGRIPMTDASSRNKGWWYNGTSWSYSWAVAHSLRWYLSGARNGIVAKEVSSASDLIPGDIICYDFQGDGRWDHNTIVVAKDQNNEPLVNAHTYNSRMRYWAYEDSTAYTPNIRYKFFHILDSE
ncbi:amidase domain-containing protein [Bacillus sp. Marseille-P3661]|uniref:amidase domain-containing protein n=1 Tax=Bacillus sp. Marseille-P3661 TaxID=1936234 RepID=UPI000C85F26B|nr:amidase domain-containing protein [Bacillus sp. Marseille-P3661]